MSRPCPCGAKATFDKHCQPVIEGKVQPETAERLMRARFTAYGMGDVDFLIRTTAAEFREKLDADELQEYCDAVRCISLKVLGTEGGGPKDETGVVRFHASLMVDGKRTLHSEVSRFHREDGAWVYAEDPSDGDEAEEDAEA
ncbi:MAG TPA: YchJ family metal-binding protein [Holophagaceae bacterium]|nr:YchJ family metal-binding protein [Holophagaceae bacterium]